MRGNVAVVTLGCEKNSVDSEVMLGLAAKHGYALVDEPGQADVIIVNTCAFIDTAKEESVDMIISMAEHKLKGRCKALLVAGCLAQRYHDELLQEIPEIDGLVGTGEFNRIGEVMEAALKGDRPTFVGNPVYIYDEFTPRHGVGSGPSAYVKIAEGCDHACTFCIIPALRGKFRSRTIESITAEAHSLVACGVKEINLIAQDSTQYGLDVYGRRSVPELLMALNNVEGLEWIRLHYAYPGFFTNDVIDAFSRLSKVCKYIDMPLQHSEDHILRSMQRPGRQKHIRSLLARMRERIADVSIRTSFIVGFPGETDEDFDNLVSFVREMEFDHVGVFTYSQEEGTASAEFAEQVADDVKQRRANILMEAAREIAALRNGRFVGRTVPVLLEGRDETDQSVYVGRTPYDAKEIDGVVYVTGKELSIGEVVDVRITHSFEFDLAGEVF